MQEADQLRQFLNSTTPMLLVISNKNTIHTELLSDATELVDTEQMILRLKGRSDTSPSTLIDLFNKHWAIKIKKTNTPYNTQLSEILNDLGKRQQQCLLIVDQAQLLPISVLAALCHLSHQQETQGVSVRIILSGQRNLLSKINALYLKKFAFPPVITRVEKNSETKAKEPAATVISARWHNHWVKVTTTLGILAFGLAWITSHKSFLQHEYSVQIAHLKAHTKHV